LKKFLASGLLLIFILSACSGDLITGEESPQLQIPTSTQPVSAAAQKTAGDPGVTETVLPPTSAPDRSCSEASGVIEPFEISWKDELLTGRVYLPPCYGLNPDREYPSLYMLHGALASDQEWDDLGLDEMADSLISKGEISPLIIIMPREITWIVLPENHFGDYLIKAIIPWIDIHYQTLDDRDYRAVGGMSRGGNWAVRLGLLHWGLFGSIGAHSTPLFIGDLKRVPGWVEIIPISQTPRILLDIGQDDNNLAEAEALHETFLDLKIPHEWRISPGLHDENYWRSHLEEYLKWYDAGWTEQ
jgi:enterochelin esterase-like enzyme